MLKTYYKLLNDYSKADFWNSVLLNGFAKKTVYRDMQRDLSEVFQINYDRYEFYRAFFERREIHIPQYEPVIIHKNGQSKKTAGKAKKGQTGRRRKPKTA